MSSRIRLQRQKGSSIDPEATLFHHPQRPSPSTAEIPTISRHTGAAEPTDVTINQSALPVHLNVSTLPILPAGSASSYPPGTPIQRQSHVRVVPRMPAWQPGTNLAAQPGPNQGDLAQRIRAAHGSGEPLEPQVQRRLESGLGADLSNVRVHTDDDAHDLARSVHARAFTSGSDIFFRHGTYDPVSSSGLHLLAHEATHTIQQSAGPVTSRQHVGGASVSDPGDPFERAAEVAADRVTRLPADRQPPRVMRQTRSEPHPGPTECYVQRSVDQDLQSGNASLDTARQYQDWVSNSIKSYTKLVHDLSTVGDGRIEQHADQMAGGYKTWAQNYYNKSQAYLFEADLAFNSTNTNSNPNRFGILGVNTDTESDFKVVSEQIDVSTGVPRVAGTETKAVEVKASTSDRYASLDKLVADGMGQLRKREQTGNFSNLALHVHNDSQNNHWPITDGDFANTYNSNIANIPAPSWSPRLNTRMTQMKNTKGINLQVAVTIYHDGQPYAQTTV